MGGWYRVTKTIKGNQYVYEQQTYREKGRVRTRNRYVGPAAEHGPALSGDNAVRAAVTTTAAGVFRGAGSFGKAMLEQFDAERRGKDISSQLGLGTGRVKRVTTTGRRHKKKVFLGKRDGKTYYLVVAGAERETQTAPSDEIWLISDEEVTTTPASGES